LSADVLYREETITALVKKLDQEVERGTSILDEVMKATTGRMVCGQLGNLVFRGDNAAAFVLPYAEH
jgi:hypothetical protein